MTDLVLIKILAIFLTLFGIFMCGGSGVSAVWQEQLKQANEKTMYHLVNQEERQNLLGKVFQFLGIKS